MLLPIHWLMCPADVTLLQGSEQGHCERVEVSPSRKTPAEFRCVQKGPQNISAALVVFLGSGGEGGCSAAGCVWVVLGSA